MRPTKGKAAILEPARAQAEAFFLNFLEDHENQGEAALALQKWNLVFGFRYLMIIRRKHYHSKLKLISHKINSKNSLGIM